MNRMRDVLYGGTETYAMIDHALTTHVGAESLKGMFV